MSDAPLDEIEIRNREALEELAQTLEWSVGSFHLLLARCNYVSVRSQLIARLLEICPVAIQVITLTGTTEKLYTTIREVLGDPHPEAVVVVGFEQVPDLDQLFAAADSAREEFRKNFAFPLVFWLDDDQFNRFKNRAPNFESWAPVDTPVFAIAASNLLESLQSGVNAVFQAAFDPQQKSLRPAIASVQQFGELQRSEVPNALQLLRDQHVPLPPALEADLHFIQAFDHWRSEDTLAHYQSSIDYYRAVAAPSDPANPLPALKLAIILFFLGRYQFLQVDLARRTSHAPFNQQDWNKAREPFEECVQLLDACDRPDLVAKVIRRLGAAFQRLEQWENLEAVARRGRELHQTYEMPRYLTVDYSYLSESTLRQNRWAESKQYALQALGIMRQLPPEDHWREGIYLSLLARAEAKMGNTQEAIALLERARELGDRGHPTTYCIALEVLRELYLQQKRYLDAFKLKQARLEVEKIAGIRAFVGAGRLGAQARLLTESNNPDALAPEISASGRQFDLQRLLERIGRNDFKLTVIYGSSGVGKSSLMNAGLIPTLKGRAIGTKANRVVLVRKYTDWVGNLLTQVTEALGPLPPPVKIGAAPANPPPPLFITPAAQPVDLAQAEINTAFRAAQLHLVLQRLRDCESLNLRPILIFDQFEEFFFANTNLLDRRRFFEFLGDCLQIPFINVILSLREDYIHYLLEANRVTGMGAIGSDILSSSVLYGLGNFPPEDAKAIIQDLTRRSRLYLEPDLIDTLVHDLAGELGEVRPIELQVVGAQLETERIYRLADYRVLGAKPKEELVTRYLQEVVQDCGEEYAPLAARVLYELTDERGTRPLKTHPELLRELEAANFPMPDPPVTFTTNTLTPADASLDYVLRMLSGSGIVVYLPEKPSDRYQLIHDYIAEAIRKKYAPHLSAAMDERLGGLGKASSFQKNAAHVQEEAKALFTQARQRLKVATGMLAISGLIMVLALFASAMIVTHAKNQESPTKLEIN